MFRPACQTVTVACNSFPGPFVRCPVLFTNASVADTDFSQWFFGMSTHEQYPLRFQERDKAVSLYIPRPHTLSPILDLPEEQRRNEGR